MADIYEPDKLKEDALQKKLILDTAVDVQVVLQVLIEKEIMTEEELNTWRARVRNFPKYKASFEMIKRLNETAELYEKDPQAYLKALLNAKMNGDIK